MPLDAGGGTGAKGATRLVKPRPRVARKPSATVRRTPMARVSQPVTHKAPVYRSSGGGGGGGSSSGGIRGNSGTPGGGSGPVPKVQKPMSLGDWLTKDSEYQDQLRNFSKTWTDFLADIKVRKSRFGTDYETGRNQMGDQRVKDLESFKNDFASRGLLQSGLYADRLGQYEKEYNTNLGNLTQQRDRALQDASLEQTNFGREQSLAKERARKSAASRRTAGL